MTEIALLKEGIKFAPSLVVSLIIIWFFLRYLNDRDKRDVEERIDRSKKEVTAQSARDEKELKKEKMLQEDFNKRDETLKLISSQAFENQKRSDEVIIKNTEAFGEIKHALSKKG